MRPIRDFSKLYGFCIPIRRVSPIVVTVVANVLFASTTIPNVELF